jgi:hypothetical protein
MIQRLPGEAFAPIAVSTFAESLQINRDNRLHT